MCCAAAALLALRKRLRAGPGGAREGVAELVRLSPSFAELLRVWEALHGAAVFDAAPPLLAAVADALSVTPASPAEATSVVHLALDGLTRTVRRAVGALHMRAPSRRPSHRKPSALNPEAHACGRCAAPAARLLTTRRPQCPRCVRRF